MTQRFPRTPLHTATPALVLGALLAACADQPAPTTPAMEAVACPSGTVPANTGGCAQASDVIVSPGASGAALAGPVGIAAVTSFTTFDSPDASWTVFTTLINISDIENFTDVTAVADEGLTVSFSPAMEKRRAPIVGNWATWSSPPEAEVSDPHVLFSQGATSVTLTLSQTVSAFGFEIEPNPFALHTFTVTFINTSISTTGPTTVGTITREVHGFAGARLMAGQSSVPFDKVTISGTADFAIAQIRYRRDDAGTSTAIIGPSGGVVTVEEGGKPVAGISIPPGTFTDNVIVMTELVELGPEQDCHGFLVGQTAESPCVKITAKNVVGGGDATFTPDPLKPVIVGFCVPGTVVLPEIFKFESPNDPPAPLRKTTAGFLECEPKVGSARPSNWFAGLVHRLGRWLAPRPLMAAVDRGFGGIIDDGGFSFFTWAAPIEISHAGLAINVLNSGKDGFALKGRFNLGGATLSLSAAPTVVVRFGDGGGTADLDDEVDQTILGSAFRFRFGRWIYTALKGTTIPAVLAMELHPDGRFALAGATPNDGDVRGVKTFRKFTLKIVPRGVQGAGLECDAIGICRVHVD